MLQIGAEIPSTLLTLSGIQIDLNRYFRNRVGVLFGVPGAFVSSDADLAAIFRDRAEALRNEVDFIGCLANNDPHVLKAWGQSLGVSDQYILISDYEGKLAKRLGVLDESAKLGPRMSNFVIICYESRIHWFAIGDDISFEAIDQALIQRPELLKTNRHLVHTRCLQLDSPCALLESVPVDFRPCGPQELQIAVEYTLLDENDIMQAASQRSHFPLVPGRVFMGSVVTVGTNVTDFQTGDYVVVSCITDSCRQCRQCRRGDPQYCEYATPTNNGRMRDGSWLLGGLSRDYTIDSAFACHVPPPFRHPDCLPLLGPGLAVYSALKKYRNHAHRSEKLGIIGSQMWALIANKVAVSMGFEVTLVDPLGLMSNVVENDFHGSKYVPLSEENLLAQRGCFDLVITQIHHVLDINIILDLAKAQGKVVVVSSDLSDRCEVMADIIPLPLIFSNRSVVGSCCGSPSELRQILRCEKLTASLPSIGVVDCDKVDSFLQQTAQVWTPKSTTTNGVAVRVRESLG
eukprot:Protomagalhaensia_sp_Gyna_25__5491@NODE_72_length_5603_cov_36_969267_g54_i0_p2_GENE_NODE_72_length_5603_cov_36_969267_g54_i0NODE_72_length_5603_cov_36_969267_g54_i0_p2_ORF_typecomplete_len516_score50_88ADH_N/PF08240_12/7_2e18Redoxin/PF08534_10/2_6e11Redoxin/PF08534_10/3_7e03Redoxin/PF08534_10/1_2e03AhpCTSA/PF00578_21/0_00085AhpCTSA/PF00578_21/9_6e02AhpCTSA/PF00578_21/1_7e03NADH_4Fe4S/PF10589_9/0_053Glu_dehyd_C/PF16912_5/0_12ADH_zinc_N/PF00107_26/0_23_NODE_72_length_5603_cov_36_969267_g54_i013762